MTIDEKQRARFEELGPDAVRSLILSGGFPHPVQFQAIQWLAEKDRESARLVAASQAEMAEAASRAATAAERAATAAEEQARTARHALITAIAATIIAAVALIVSIYAALHLP